MNDYQAFNKEKRKEIIIEYIDFIKSLGFNPVKVYAGEDPNQIYSFRAILEFKRPNMIQIVRKHTAFFEARNYSQFSLYNFFTEVLETTKRETLKIFSKALKIRIWNTGFTDEEILCAILGQNQELLIQDLVEDGKLIIPNSEIKQLFFTLNVLGGNQQSKRIIKR